ncbi:hypothetical protein GSB9_00936 [Flavobacteriaceae bacterium GSB9]|nr:hypothetical protein GSB9_00936 [Flavobacteriaceae bacterium GSB9]
MAFLKTLKNLVYPVTLLTGITFLSFVVSIDAIYIGFTHESPAIIYAVFAVPITIFIMSLYAVDRILVKKMAYYKLLISELVVLVIIALAGYFVHSYNNVYTNVRVSTTEDYILVLFDTDEKSLDKFSKKGLLGRERLIEDANIVHLGKSLASKQDLRVVPPDSWMGTYRIYGTYLFQGDSIHYSYILKENSGNDFVRASQVYIDSLIAGALH